MNQLRDIMGEVGEPLRDLVERLERLTREKTPTDLLEEIRRAIRQHPDGINAKTEAIVKQVGGTRQDVLKGLRELQSSGEFKGHTRKPKRVNP
jgi:hypothetical protein